MTCGSPVAHSADWRREGERGKEGGGREREGERGGEKERGGEREGEGGKRTHRL